MTLDEKLTAWREEDEEIHFQCMVVRRQVSPVDWEGINRRREIADDFKILKQMLAEHHKNTLKLLGLVMKNAN